MSEDCKDRTPEDHPVVDKEGIMKYGVGCYRVIIGMGWHPECSEKICPKIHSSNRRTNKK